MNWFKAALDGVQMVAGLVSGAMQARKLDKLEQARRIKERAAKNSERDDELRRKARGK